MHALNGCGRCHGRRNPEAPLLGILQEGIRFGKRRLLRHGNIIALVNTPTNTITHNTHNAHNAVGPYLAIRVVAEGSSKRGRRFPVVPCFIRYGSPLKINISERFRFRGRLGSLLHCCPLQLKFIRPNRKAAQDGCQETGEVHPLPAVRCRSRRYFAARRFTEALAWRCYLPDDRDRKFLALETGGFLVESFSRENATGLWEGARAIWGNS